MTTPFPKLVQFLKSRELHGMTQLELAEAIGIPYHTLLRYIKTDACLNPQLTNYQAIERFYQRWVASSESRPARRARR